MSIYNIITTFTQDHFGLFKFLCLDNSSAYKEEVIFEKIQRNVSCWLAYLSTILDFNLTEVSHPFSYL